MDQVREGVLLHCGLDYLGLLAEFLGPLDSIQARTRSLMRNRPSEDIAIAHPGGAKLVLGKVDVVTASVLLDVAQDVGKLQGDANIASIPGLPGAIDLENLQAEIG